MAKRRQENAVEALRLQQKRLSIAAQRQRLDTASMWVNAGFQAADIGITTGVMIGQAHDQQAVLDAQEYQKKRQDAINQARANNNTGWEQQEDGSLKWVGFENVPVAGGGTLKDLTDTYLAKMQETYWTKSGEKKGMTIIGKIINDGNAQIMEQTRLAAMGLREAKYGEAYNNAFQTAVQTNDFTLIRDVIDSTSAWKSETERQTLLEQAQDQFKIGVATERAITIGRTEGIARAEEDLQQSGLPQEVITQIMGTVQNANNNTVETAKVSAADTYTKIKQNDGTIRQAYDAAITQDISNPEALEARKAVATKKQIYDLNERFSQETNGATVAQLEALKEKYKDGGTYDADYYGMEQLQNQHYSAISESIDEIYRAAARAEEEALAKQERAAAKAERAEAKAERDAAKIERAAEKKAQEEEKRAKEDSATILNTVRNEFTQWQQGKKDGRTMWYEIEVFKNHIPYDERRRMERELIAGIDGTGTDAAWHYDRLETIMEAYAPDKETASIAEIDAHNQRVRQMKEYIMERRFRGVSGDLLKKEIDNILEVEISQILRDAVSKADIGSNGLGGDAQKTAKEYLWFANQGKLDIYFGERTTTELSFDDEGRITRGIIPLIIGGDNMNTVYAQVNSFSRDYLNNELGQANITVGEGQMMPGKDDSHGGNFRHKGSDGNWYRLNVKSRNGDFIIEKLNGKEWEKVAVQKLPGYVRRRPAYVPFNSQNRWTNR
ncbi:MAG: hypothetical protein LBF78_07545 [Treponema sp.]|nr:hypothetical protein [Treponema sp.]